ncbi:Dit2p [Sugiyamaella lignohabitans]|uniref:Dit2p n=1 Tax=Sugiyamaella lignohabitans TaxID=796027 RepID=A0A167FCI2_9ASCO|nr:Dit2p [Sugiyamaella lignohabitans]ANB15119.1 Dit2p [Sugiyamaella lignohabitans]
MVVILGKLALLVAFAVLFVVFREVYIRWELIHLAKKHRTKPPTRLLDSFPLGIANFRKARQASVRNETCDFMMNLFKSGHDTLHDEVMGLNRIVTRDPENVKAVLATNFKDFSLGLRHGAFYPLLGDGIFTLSGEGWKHSRALLRPQFSRQQVSQLNSLNEHVDQLIRNFKRDSNQDNGRGFGFFDAQVYFHNLTLDTATEFLFGESVDSLSNGNRQVQGPEIKVTAQEFAECFNGSLKTLRLRIQLGKLSFLANPDHFKHEVKICHNFVDYFVHKTLAETEKEKADSGDQEFSYIFIEQLAKQTRDPKVIRDQAFNILLAGRDTTASLLSFALFILARDKRVWNKLRDEVLTTFGNDSSKITFESLKRSTYLTNTINEVLRLFPIVPSNSRMAIADTILPRGGGEDESSPVFVKKGTTVSYVVYVMQRTKKYWGEDAEDFRPERWEEGKLHMWDYLPFNGGPRICLGQQFALTEISFTLVRILQTFRDVEPHPDATPSFKDLRGLHSLTLSVAEGVWLRLIE